MDHWKTPAEEKGEGSGRAAFPSFGSLEEIVIAGTLRSQ
jgi:hypothetical protein